MHPRAGRTAEGPLTCEAIGDALAALLPEGAIVSDEMVSSGAAVLDRLHAAAPFDRLPNTGGSIGQGLPVALGAACAAPHRKVVALEADGSAMYTFQALWTMARENLDVVTVIFANRRYRILEIEMRRAGIDSPGPAARAMMESAGRISISCVSPNPWACPLCGPPRCPSFGTNSGRPWRPAAPL